jgi:hypothetical protein
MYKTSLRLALSTALTVSVASCGPPPEITNPKWAKMPTSEEMQKVFPTFAGMADLSGRVQLRCTAEADGRLSDCTIRQVAPDGIGFEAAGLALAKDFRLSPKTIDGAPVGASVAFTIVFRSSGAPPVQPYAGPTPLPSTLEITRRMAAGNARGLSRTILDTDLQVEPGRKDAVTAMLERAVKATERERTAADALALARALSPAQQRNLAAGRAPGGTLPTNAQIAAVGPEFETAGWRLTQHLRAEYCAAYACGDVLTEAEPGSR